MRKAPTLLVTGFGPFPGVDVNPTARLVERLQIRDGARGDIVYGCLPTDWEAVDQAFEALVARHHPDRLLHLGYAECSPGFQLETTAYNETCCEADQSGQKATGSSIIDVKTACLQTSLPIPLIEQQLSDHGLVAHRSADPGRYLCNKLYFLSLHRWHNAAPAKQLPSLFVHIPAVRFEGSFFPSSHTQGKTLPLADAVKGIDLIMKVLLSFEAEGSGA